MRPRKAAEADASQMALGVEVRLNTYAEAEDVMAEAPDVVIVATGGWPEAPDVTGGVAGDATVKADGAGGITSNGSPTWE